MADFCEMLDSWGIGIILAESKPNQTSPEFRKVCEREPLLMLGAAWAGASAWSEGGRQEQLAARSWELTMMCMWG